MKMKSTALEELAARKEVAKRARMSETAVRAYKRYFERNPSCSNNRYLAGRAEDAYSAWAAAQARLIALEQR